MISRLRVGIVVTSDDPVRLNIPTIVTVGRTIRHARKQSAKYRWPVAREALVRILTDLEARGDDPSLDKLRGIIQRGDQKYPNWPSEAQRPGFEPARGERSDGLPNPALTVRADHEVT